MPSSGMCYYDALTPKKPFKVTVDWLTIVVRNLKKGDFYIVPLLFHAPNTRPLRVNIMKAGSENKVEHSFEFVVGRQLNKKGKDTWLAKRYKLGKARHNGTALIKVGWDPKDSRASASGIPFNIAGGILEFKGNARQQRIDQGLCPVCGEPGEWRMLAMVCDEHGVFIG